MSNASDNWKKIIKNFVTCTLAKPACCSTIVKGYMKQTTAKHVTSQRERNDLSIKEMQCFEKLLSMATHEVIVKSVTQSINGSKIFQHEHVHV